MNFKKLTLILLFIAMFSTAQNSNKVLFLIDNEPVYTQEFIEVYSKNKSLVDGDAKKGIENYLNLYVNYKLKVKEAYELQLDTIPKFINELNSYKATLIVPYLKDKQVSEKLLTEAYDRLLKEVDVSHILIFVNPDAAAKDTLNAYNKLLEAKDLIAKGNDFATVAMQYSDDPTVKQNAGNIGYFTGLQMVYPFENVAFTTNIGDVSMPFRTKFGYHILKVNDIRTARGEVEAAHIMIKYDSIFSRTKIDSIYKEVSSHHKDFFELAKVVSDDKASAIQGGLLPKFGTGHMVESFAKEVFALKNEGDVSPPFQTPFGWHIAKLIKKYPIESFDKLKAKLIERIENDDRSHLISKAVINKLFTDYNVQVNTKALQQFSIENWQENSENFNNILLTFKDVTVYQKSFISYLNKIKNPSIDKAFVNFKEQEVLNYYKTYIERDNLEFAKTFKEFKEGLLLFDLLEKRVWEKSKDTTLLQAYYNENKLVKYQNKAFETVKGTVISDFQELLEKQWIESLHKKYKVDFNKSEKNKVLKLKI